MRSRPPVAPRLSSPAFPSQAAPRTGVRTEPGPPVLSPSPAASYPTSPVPRARAYPARRPGKASRRRGCILLLLRLLSTGWQERKASAASPPHAASANFPSPPGPKGSGAPCAPAAALRLRSATEAALCPAADSAPPTCVPSALARSLSPRPSATCRLRLWGTFLCRGAPVEAARLSPNAPSPRAGSAEGEGSEPAAGPGLG